MLTLQRTIDLVLTHSSFLIPHFTNWSVLSVLVNEQYTVRSDEAFRFAVGSFIENVRFVLVYRQAKANMCRLIHSLKTYDSTVLVYRQTKAEIVNT
jgi:hypothetical protein